MTDLEVLEKAAQEATEIAKRDQEALARSVDRSVLLWDAVAKMKEKERIRRVYGAPSP